MNLSVTWSIAIQLGCLAIGILLPAFVPMSSAQQSALETFVGAVQATLGLRAYWLTPKGEPTNSSSPKPQAKPQGPA